MISHLTCANFSVLKHSLMHSLGAVVSEALKLIPLTRKVKFSIEEWIRLMMDMTF